MLFIQSSFVFSQTRQEVTYNVDDEASRLKIQLEAAFHKYTELMRTGHSVDSAEVKKAYVDYKEMYNRYYGHMCTEYDSSCHLVGGGDADTSVADYDTTGDDHDDGYDDDYDHDDTHTGKASFEETKAAYQDFEAAYGKLTGYMVEGEGGSSEADEAYQEYERTKKRFEMLYGQDIDYNTDWSALDAMYGDAGADQPAQTDSGADSAVDSRVKDDEESAIAKFLRNFFRSLTGQRQDDAAPIDTGKKDDDFIPTWEKRTRAGKVGVTDVSTAYQEYISAYNELSDQMAQGLGDTDEAQEVYERYKNAKEKYEGLTAQGRGEAPAEKTGDEFVPTWEKRVRAGKDDVSKAYQEYMNALDEFNELVDKGGADSGEEQEALERVENLRDKYEELSGLDKGEDEGEDKGEDKEDGESTSKKRKKSKKNDENGEEVNDEEVIPSWKKREELGKLTKREKAENKKLGKLDKKPSTKEYFTDIFLPTYLDNMDYNHRYEDLGFFGKTWHYALEEIRIMWHHTPYTESREKNDPEVVFATGWGTCGDTVMAFVKKAHENADDFYPLTVTCKMDTGGNHISIINIPESEIRSRIEEKQRFLDGMIKKAEDKMAKFPSQREFLEKTISKWKGQKQKFSDFDGEYGKNPKQFTDASSELFITGPPLDKNGNIDSGKARDWDIVDPWTGDLTSWHLWSTNFRGEYMFNT